MIGEPSNDLELLATRSSNGDAAAFDELVRRTHRLAFQLALRMLGNEQEVDDVLQDAYLRVWQGLAGLRDRSAVLAWICRIVRNVAADRVRRHKRQRARHDVSADLEALLESRPCESPGPEVRVAQAEQGAAIAAALAELRPKHRIVLLLREVDDMSYDQISVALGIPLGTVESRLYRARRELAGKLRRLARRDNEEAA